MAEGDQRHGRTLARAGAVALVEPGEAVFIGVVRIGLDLGEAGLQPGLFLSGDTFACRRGLQEGERHGGQGEKGHGSDTPEPVTNLIDTKGSAQANDSSAISAFCRRAWL